MPTSRQADARELEAAGVATAATAAVVEAAAVEGLPARRAQSLETIGVTSAARAADESSEMAAIPTKRRRTALSRRQLLFDVVFDCRAARSRCMVPHRVPRIRREARDANEFATPTANPRYPRKW